MSTFTQTITERFHVVACYTCGVRFGIDSQLYRRVVTDAIGSVHCPACGEETCWRESEAQKQIRQLEQKLKWEADNAERQRNMRKEAEGKLISAKGQITKLKKRVSAGVCPCCNRTFKQLSRHMETQHPDYLVEVKS